MSGNTETNSNSMKYVPMPLSALLPNLMLQTTPASPDCSYSSSESDNSPGKTVKPLLEDINKELLSSTPKSPKEMKILSKHFDKENTINDSLSSRTYPNKDSYSHNAVKNVLTNVYPSSEVKKRNILIPQNINTKCQIPLLTCARENYKMPSCNANKNAHKNTPNMLKLPCRISQKKTPENPKLLSSQKVKVSTPVVKSGIRRFTPSSARKSQKKIFHQVVTEQNKDSVRCLFPESQKNKEQNGVWRIPNVNETPSNRKPHSISNSATPSYPQGLVGQHNKVFFKTTHIKGKKYMYMKKLGTGGSSVVYKIFDMSTSCEYAVKCVNMAVEQELAQGYINEVRLLRELQNSDRVIRLYDYEYDRSSQLLRVVLEVGDTDLSSLLRTRGVRLSPALVLHYWEEMLHAVLYIHEHGVIHADLKPANFLLVNGHLKLIDFGIASAISSDATSVVRSQAAGTYSYISPEALGGLGLDSGPAFKISFKSDVWSLGCILYSMVYGHTPFSHIPNLAKLAVIRDPNHRIEYPPVQHLPASLIAALKSCLTYNAHGRPKVQQLLDIPYISAEDPPHPDSLLDKTRATLTAEEYDLMQKRLAERPPHPDSLLDKIRATLTAEEYDLMQKRLAERPPLPDSLLDKLRASLTAEEYDLMQKLIA